MAKTILVLGDGETWDAPEGCRILTITDEAYEQIECEQIKVKHLDQSQIIAVGNVSEEQI